MATHRGIVRICIIICKVTVFFPCMRIWVIDLNVKKIAAIFMLMFWQLFALTFTCIYFGMSRSILHDMIYHTAALVLQNFSFCILEVVNNSCLLGVCEFHVILTARFLAFNELAQNMKCVSWFAFYCTFLSAFFWGIMYWVSGSLRWETGGNHSDVTYISVTCDVTRRLVPAVSKTSGTLRNVLQAGRSRVRFSTESLEIFTIIRLLAAPWPWGWPSLEQKWVPGIFPVGKGGRCIWLTTLPLSCAYCLEI